MDATQLSSGRVRRADAASFELFVAPGCRSPLTTPRPIDTRRGELLS